MIGAWQGACVVATSGLLAVVYYFARDRGTAGALAALELAERGLRDSGMDDAANEVYGLACAIAGGHINPKQEV